MVRLVEHVLKYASPAAEIAELRDGRRALISLQLSPNGDDEDRGQRYDSLAERYAEQSEDADRRQPRNKSRHPRRMGGEK